MTHTLIRLDENKNFVIPGIILRYEQNSMIVFIEIQLYGWASLSRKTLVKLLQLSKISEDRDTKQHFGLIATSRAFPAEIAFLLVGQSEHRSAFFREVEI